MKEQKDPKIEVVRATGEDIEDIYTLEKLCFAVPWPLQVLFEDIALNDHIYLLIKENGKTVGYGSVWLVLDEGHINNICIHPDYRQKGYGRILLEQICAYARRYGADSITLEVRTSNVPAINLYSSMDFRLEGVRKNYYQDNGEDALIMWKQGLKTEL